MLLNVQSIVKKDRRIEKQNHQEPLNCLTVKSCRKSNLLTVRFTDQMHVIDKSSSRFLLSTVQLITHSQPFLF